MALDSETYTAMLTNRDDLADAFDLVLGLCRFCDANGDERIKGMATRNRDKDRQVGGWTDSHAETQINRQHTEPQRDEICS